MQTRRNGEESSPIPLAFSQLLGIDRNLRLGQQVAKAEHLTSDSCAVQSKKVSFRSMKQWYTLHTKPNSEYQVVAALNQRQIETYLPEVEISKPRQARSRTPFFPCYLFVWADLGAMSLSQLQWTPGLRRIVAFGGRAVPLPDQVIDLIRRRLGEIEVAGGWSDQPFNPGDRVQIMDGPFKGLQAIFEGSASPGERVQVFLEILGRLSRAQVSVTDLKAAASSVETPHRNRPRRTRGRGRRVNRKT